MTNIDSEQKIYRHRMDKVSVDYEKGIHRHWMEVAAKERPHHTQEVIRTIKERFERGSISEAQLIDWGREFENSPHTLIETLLYYGLDLDD